MSIRRKTQINIKIMKKVRLYIITPFLANEEYRICDEITDEIYATTTNQELAIIIKDSIENHMNKTL